MSKLRSPSRQGVVLAAFLAALALATSSPGAAQAPNTEAVDPQDAVAFIDDLAVQAAGTFHDPTLNREGRDAQLRSLLDQSFNLRYISLLALGPYRQDFEPAALKTYEGAFGDYLYAKYAALLATYADRSFHAVEAERAGSRDAVVHLMVARPQSGMIDTVWRIRSFDGALRIIDVSIAGFSMLESQREEFANEIRRSGIDGFLNSLRARATTTHA